jgi:hypothetical protein
MRRAPSPTASVMSDAIGSPFPVFETGLATGLAARGKCRQLLTAPASWIGGNGPGGCRSACRSSTVSGFWGRRELFDRIHSKYGPTREGHSAASARAWLAKNGSQDENNRPGPRSDLYPFGANSRKGRAQLKTPGPDDAI